MQAKKTILLVEDEVLIALAEAQTIEGFGFKVILAHAGDKAVEIATGIEKPHLILMDIDLGKGISGPEAAAMILQRTDIPNSRQSSQSVNVRNLRWISRISDW